MQSYRVSGMTCGECAKKVTAAVEEIPHVERALVDLSAGTLTVAGKADEQTIRRAVSQAGYTIEEILSS